MPHVRAVPPTEDAAVVLDGSIYAIGGADIVNFLATGEWYDLSTDTWTPVKAMGPKRNGLAAVVLNGLLCPRRPVPYHNGAVYSRHRHLDPRQGHEHQTRGLAAVVLNGRIYTIGGYDGVTLLPTVERYDPATDAWTTVKAMSTGRYYVAAAVL